MSWEETRETMYLASLTNRLTRDKLVTTTVQEDFSQEEVKAIMLDKSPIALYVIPYSEKIPAINITKIIMPSDEGVYLYWDSWADKTPIHYPWEKFYDMLRSVGLRHFRF